MNTKKGRHAAMYGIEAVRKIAFNPFGFVGEMNAPIEKPPTNFPSHVVNDLLKTVQYMYMHVTSATTPLLSNDDIVSLVYPPEMKYKFSPDSSRALFEIMWRPLNIPVTFRGNGTFYCQDDEPRPVFQANADPALIASVTEYIQFKYMMRKDYGRLRSVITELTNENVVWRYNKRGLARQVTVPKFSRREIRYFFPAILPLLQRTGLKGYLVDMEEITVPKKGKQLPFGLRKACELASETVAAFELLGELKAQTWRSSIDFSMETIREPYDEHGFKFYDFT